MSEELVVGMGQRDRELPPAGVHTGCITGIYNIGRQWNNFNKEYKPIIKIKFELNVNNKQNKPFVVYQDYTASMDARANLRTLVHSLEGRDLNDTEAAAYSVGKILGRCVLIQLTHKLKQDGRTYKYVLKNFMPTKDSFTPAVSPEKWDFRTGDPNDAPDWVWDAYKESPDFREPKQPRVAKPRTELGQALAAASPAAAVATSDDDSVF